MSKITDQSYVTLVTNEHYLKGGLVLGQSLRDSNTNRNLTCMVTSELSENSKKQLGNVYDEVIVVESLDSKDAANLKILVRPELGITFTKLFAWKLTHYKKCVFMDADTLVLQNIAIVLIEMNSVL